MNGKRPRMPGGGGPGGPGGDGGKPGMSIWTILLVALLAWWTWSLFSNWTSNPQVPYSVFRQQLQQDNVSEVTVQGETLRGSFQNPVSVSAGRNQTTEVESFRTYVPSFGDDRLMGMLEEREVQVHTRPTQDGNWWLTLLMFLPLLLFGGLIYFQYKQMRGRAGGLFSIGKSKAKLYDRSKEGVTMDDVAGAEGAKTELKEIIAYLKDPGRVRQLGADVPKGVLLVGPPGTGKTLLARAVAGEAEVPFFSITGSDFMEMFVGVGASRVRDLFKDAKKEAPAIIFIDELDSIGRQRGAGLGGGHDEREQTLNQILNEMDGFEPNENVVVMSATNRPDILDPALVRPGRFDRRIVVEMPNTRARLAILQIYARNKPMAEDADLESLARGTPGFSGADLENLLNEAALLAARKEKDSIGAEEVEQARDKILMGLKRQGLAISEAEKRMVAFHEAGHAVAAAVLPHADPVHKVSIIPRTRSMGATQQLPSDERYIYQREYMQDRLAVMMGGRAAETLYFDTATSGAGNDLQQATKLARKMVLEWGMSDAFRNMALGGESKEVFLGEELAHRRDYSEATAREVDEEVHRILQQSYERCVSTLQEHTDELEKVAEELLEHEELPGARVLELLGRDPAEVEEELALPEQEDAEGSEESGGRETGRAGE